MSKISNFIKSNKDAIIKPVVVLLAICIVIPLALSVTNKFTAHRIEKLQEENEKSAMEGLINADEFKPCSLNIVDVAEPFNYYIAIKNEEEIGYIFTTSSKGYGGEVSVMTVVDNDGKVTAVSILDASNETPGLGQNVTKEGFYSQYSGKKSGVKIVKNGATDENNEINAVTGATISSTAVTNAVNQALENYKAVIADNKNLPETEVAADE